MSKGLNELVNNMKIPLDWVNDALDPQDHNFSRVVKETRSACADELRAALPAVEAERKELVEALEECVDVIHRRLDDSEIPESAEVILARVKEK